MLNFMLAPKVMDMVGSAAAATIFVPVDMMNACSEEAMERPLTKRAREFLPGFLAGQSNRKIANHLGLSEVTIKHHLKGLCSKLGATKRTLAVCLAIELGLS